MPLFEAPPLGASGLSYCRRKAERHETPTTHKADQLENEEEKGRYNNAPKSSRCGNTDLEAGEQSHCKNIAPCTFSGVNSPFPSHISEIYATILNFGNLVHAISKSAGWRTSYSLSRGLCARRSSSVFMKRLSPGTTLKLNSKTVGLSNHEAPRNGTCPTGPQWGSMPNYLISDLRLCGDPSNMQDHHRYTHPLEIQRSKCNCSAQEAESARPVSWDLLHDGESLRLSGLKFPWRITNRKRAGSAKVKRLT